MKHLGLEIQQQIGKEKEQIEMKETASQGKID
jgi:hypothetical protein